MKAWRPAKLHRIAVTTAAVSILTVVIRAASADAQISFDRDFASFWQTFRKATLERDWKTLTQMCNFPVTVKGVLDRDPVYRVNRGEFPRVFDQFLSEGVISPNEQLDFIRKTRTLADDGRPARRVGNMIFRRTPKGWLLHTFYMEYTSDS